MTTPTFDVIYNEDCFDTMSRMGDGTIDIVLTSPPYNMTPRKGGTSDKGRYDVYRDWMSEDDYLLFTERVFNNFDRILKKNKVVLYNFSYSIESPSLPYKVINRIQNETNFTLVDTIIWKKKTGLPFPAQPRRLSRIWEFVFVFCRKNELDTFEVYKGVSKQSEKTGQRYYNVFYNYIEARNNDGVCPLNNATYSSELCEKLLRIYAPKNGLLYDPFIGSGTTAVACKNLGLNFIGSEISKMQCDFSENRIKQLRNINND